MTTARWVSNIRAGGGRRMAAGVGFDYTDLSIARERKLSDHAHTMRHLAGTLLLTLALAVPTVGTAAEVQHATTRNAPQQPWQHLRPQKLKLQSGAALVIDRAGNELFAKAADEPVPIASITKLMTAMVVLDAKLPLQERLQISRQDRDALRLTGSRLPYGATLTRAELLTLALMSSENRAAAALARTFPDGEQEFVRRMNLKAKALGLAHTRFTDSTGLDVGNVSTARELARLVRAANRYPKIREATTRRSAEVRPGPRQSPLKYVNTNRLIGNDAWSIKLSKTGYINEAGRCLVMLTDIGGESLVLVLLNSHGKLTPVGDANRVRKWLDKEAEHAMQLAGGKARPNS